MYLTASLCSSFSLSVSSVLRAYSRYLSVCLHVACSHLFSALWRSRTLLRVFLDIASYLARQLDYLLVSLSLSGSIPNQRIVHNALYFYEIREIAKTSKNVNRANKTQARALMTTTLSRVILGVQIFPRTSRFQNHNQQPLSLRWYNSQQILPSEPRDIIIFVKIFLRF